MSTDLHTAYENGDVFEEDTMNAPINELDIAVQVFGRGVAIDRDTGTPAVGPSDGDTYILPATGCSGAWAGQDGKIAYYDDDNTEWKFITPVEGMIFYLQDENRQVYYTGSIFDLFNPYIVASGYGGTPGDSQLCLTHTFVFAVTFPAGLTGSQSKAGTAADAETIFVIKKNGSNIGTITFEAAGQTGTFAMAVATSFAVGDIITIYGPASADAAIADINFQLLGKR